MSINLNDKNWAKNSKKKSKEKIIVDIDDNKNVLFDVIEFIDSGNFGNVYKAIEKRTKELVAVKRILKKGKKESREIVILKELQECPQVIKIKDLIYTYNEKNEIIQNVIMEYIKSNLDDILEKKIKNKSFFNYEEIVHYFYQILKALEYMEQKNIAHRDLKPSNLLIDEKEKIIKVCDFGSSKIINKYGKNVPYICSTFYRAPELFFGMTNYDTRIDIWSIGCIFYEIITLKILFRSQGEELQILKILTSWQGLTEEDIEYFTENLKKDQNYSNIEIILNKLPGKDTKKSSKEIIQNLRVNPYLTEKNAENKKKLENIYELLNHMLEINPEKRYKASQLLNLKIFNKI